jgi:hypothetical protein
MSANLDKLLCMRIEYKARIKACNKTKGEDVRSRF